MAPKVAVLRNWEGTVVTREELRRALWPSGTFVDFDRAINKAINQLRQLLGDDVERPRFIQTVPKCGYRFLAPVTRATSQPTQNPQVSEALLKARHFWNKRTGDAVIRSVESFRQAIEYDPLCVDAWAGLAQSRATLGVLGLQPPHDAFRSARCRRTRARAERCRPEAHIALERSTDSSNGIGRPPSVCIVAPSLSPDHATAHQFYAMLLSVLARARGGAG
jgi:hypothetical protein